MINSYLETRFIIYLVLSCNLIYYSLPGFSVHGISQAIIVEWVPSLVAIFDPGIKPTSPALAGGFFTTEVLGKHLI